MSDGPDSESPICKKSKYDDLVESNEIHQPPHMKDFTVEKILYNSTIKKCASLLGKFKDKDGVALIILDKKSFKEEDFGVDGYFSSHTELRTVFENDVYASFECFPRPLINGVKADIIYPATPQHIAKFSEQVPHIILETPKLYETLTLPHIQKEQLNLKWVYNILDGKSEQERIVHNNKSDKVGFVLLPDQKWDGVSKENLYLLAIVRQRGIKSLRDLDAEHLPLLKTIQDEGKAKILEAYNIPSSQLRIYIHYHPSFYHLHVHFSVLKHEAPGVYVERAHLLSTVIDNIEMMGDYYKKASLYFTSREMDNLFKLYETNGHVQKIKPEIQIVDK